MSAKINIDISFNLTQDAATNRKIFDHILDMTQNKTFAEISILVSLKGLSTEEVWGIKVTEKNKEQAATHLGTKANNHSRVSQPVTKTDNQ